MPGAGLHGDAGRVLSPNELLSSYLYNQKVAFVT